MFVIRSSEDAEGDRRIIGSGRRTGAFGLCAKVVLFAWFTCACCAAFRALNGAAILRTCEKSCQTQSDTIRTGIETYRLP